MQILLIYTPAHAEGEREDPFAGIDVFGTYADDVDLIPLVCKLQQEHEADDLEFNITSWGREPLTEAVEPQPEKVEG